MRDWNFCASFPTSPSRLRENFSAHGAEFHLDLQVSLGLSEKLMAIQVLTVDYNLK